METNGTYTVALKLVLTAVSTNWLLDKRTCRNFVLYTISMLFCCTGVQMLLITLAVVSLVVIHLRLQQKTFELSDE